MTELEELKEEVHRLDKDSAIAAEKLQGVEEEVKVVHGKLDEMYNVFVQAKGARWVIMSVLVALGFILSKLGSISAALLEWAK